MRWSFEANIKQMNLLVLSLSILSFANSFYTFSHKRYYRLFEQPIEATPATPSAHRVRVDSSPMASSPLRFLQNMLASSAAEARAHPDPARDVWEVAVWDPNPLCLQLFCLFSPLHVILYHFNLPVAPLDPQPSVKVVTTLVIAAIISFFLVLLRTSFSQQIKDSAVIQREVFHEYDTKFVHPNLQKLYRNVGIQTITKRGTRSSGIGTSISDLASEVDTYTPTHIINRGFRTNPNQAYASQYDPDNLGSQPSSRPMYTSSTQQTPSLKPLPVTRVPPASAATTGADYSSPIRPSNTPNPFQRSSHFRPSGDGGSLGVYSHANSPLRKSASTNFMRDDRARDSLGGHGERRREGSPVKREGSPLKRMSTPAGYSGLGVGRRESGRF